MPQKFLNKENYNDCRKQVLKLKQKGLAFTQIAAILSRLWDRPRISDTTIRSIYNHETFQDYDKMVNENFRRLSTKKHKEETSVVSGECNNQDKEPIQYINVQRVKEIAALFIIDQPENEYAIKLHNELFKK